MSAISCPNAFPIRFEESENDLLNFHHKWTHRLCYTAQEEIWKTSQEEVLQIQKIFPLIGKYFGAPCWMRKQAGQTPFCPEGERFCGVTVWKLPLSPLSKTHIKIWAFQSLFFPPFDLLIHS